MNFKEETLEAIQEKGYTIDDVMFIGTLDGKYRMTIEKFLEVSDFEYDDGYGTNEIALNLIVYFNDKSFLERYEYDGSEWWTYTTPKVFNEKDDYEELDENKLKCK